MNYQIALIWTKHTTEKM